MRPPVRLQSLQERLGQAAQSTGLVEAQPDDAQEGALPAVQAQALQRSDCSNRRVKRRLVCEIAIKPRFEVFAPLLSAT